MRLYREELVIYSVHPVSRCHNHPAAVPEVRYEVHKMAVGRGSGRTRNRYGEGTAQ